MTERTQEKNWWLWLTANDVGLQAHGFDPEDRFAHTGHRVALPERWARTVGMWGLYPSSAILETAGGTKAAYYVFKHRWALTALRPNDKIPSVLKLAESCWETVNREIVAQQGETTLAEACSKCAFTVGVLPIEMMLYTQGLDDVLKTYGIESPEVYGRMEERERLLLWEGLGALNFATGIPRHHR